MDCPYCNAPSIKIAPERDNQYHNRKCPSCTRTFATQFIVDFEGYPELFKFHSRHAAVEGRHPSLQLIDDVRILKEYFTLP